MKSPSCASVTPYVGGRRIGKTVQALFEAATLVNSKDVEVYIQVDTNVMRERVRQYFTEKLPEEKQDRVHVIFGLDDGVTLPPGTLPPGECYVINLSTKRPILYCPNPTLS